MSKKFIEFMEYPICMPIILYLFIARSSYLYKGVTPVGALMYCMLDNLQTTYRSIQPIVVNWRVEYHLFVSHFASSTSGYNPNGC